MNVEERRCKKIFCFWVGGEKLWERFCFWWGRDEVLNFEERSRKNLFCFEERRCKRLFCYGRVVRNILFEF